MSEMGTKQARESAFGDNGPIITDSSISSGDRQTLVGQYPIGIYGEGKNTGVNALAAYFPTMVFRSFAEDSKGMSGTGSFAFKVLASEKDGQVLVLLQDVSFKTENMADRTYKDLIGENANPKAQVDSDDDDTDVA
jgi:hypothetical protein